MHVYVCVCVHALPSTFLLFYVYVFGKRASRAPLQTKLAVAKEMQGATFCISEAMWAAGDFRKHVVEAPQRERALVTVKVRQDNVAGVKLPIFTLEKAAGTTLEMETLGLAGGGRQIGKAKDKFTSLLELLVWLGSLQTSFTALDEALKVTNRRVNALDNVSVCVCVCFLRCSSLQQHPPSCPPLSPHTSPPASRAPTGGHPLLSSHHCLRHLRAG